MEMLKQYIELLEDIGYDNTVASDGTTIGELTDLYEPISNIVDPKGKRNRPLELSAIKWAKEYVIRELVIYDDYTIPSAYYIRERIQEKLVDKDVEYIIVILEDLFPYKIQGYEIRNIFSNDEGETQEVLIKTSKEYLSLTTVEMLIALHIEVELIYAMARVKEKLSKQPVQFWKDILDISNNDEIEDMMFIVESILS